MNIFGKEVSNKTVIVVASIGILAIGGYVYWRKQRGKKLYDELMAGLKGTAKGLDVGYSTSETGKNVYWTSPTYWVGKSKLSDSQANEIAVKIGRSIDQKWRIITSESSQKSVFRLIKNQADASKILGKYTSNGYGSMIFDIKELSPEVQKGITTYLNELPLA